MSGTGATSLRRRLAGTLLGLGLVLLVVVTAALVLALQTREEQRRLTEDYFRSVQDSHQGFVRVLDLHAAAGDYLRRAEPADLAVARRLEQPRAGAATLAELERRLAGDPAALRALSEVAGAYQRWVEGLEPLLQAVEAGGPGAVPAELLSASDSRFDELRADYDDYVREVVAARDRAAQRLARGTELLFGAVVLAVATALVAGLLLYAALRRWVTRPLTALGEEARAVRTGSLEHVVHVEGPPEILALAEDVEAMRRGLVAQLAEVGRAQALLEQQAEELRRSNRDLEQFAYVASHDLQEPLRKVSSFCQMLQRRYGGQLDERADQYIEFAVDGAKRMQALINDLLAFSRVGRLTEGFREVALDDVLSDALRNLAVRIEESGAVVTTDPLPVVPGERRLLVQLFQNLVGNALKFAGNARPRVHLSAVRGDEAWELSVCDEGIGIEPQYAERIFVIFQRLHAKSEYEGTGIGLALCKKIVEHHGGTIWLDAQAAAGGTGTTFRWTLPFEPPVPSLDRMDDTKTGAREESGWTT